MTRVLDGRFDVGEAYVKVEGIKAILKDAERVGVAVEDLRELTRQLAEPIAARGRQLAPMRTGRLRAGIKPSRSKRKVMVRVGSAKRLAYAAPRHWGFDSRSGPKWLSVAEQQLRSSTFQGFDRGITKLLIDNGW